MKTSTAGMLAIVDHEAVVLRRYKDSVGVWTIGVGHTAAAGEIDPARFKGKLTLEDALALFSRDLKKYEDRVNRAVHIPVEQHEFDALVSFDFNTGAVHRATLTKSLNAGNRKAAARQFMNWKKPREIIGRRKKEQTLFRSGFYPAVARLKVYDQFPGRVRLVAVPGGFAAEPFSPPPPDIPAPEEPTDTSPTPEQPKQGFAAAFLSILTAIFGRK